MGKVSQFSIYLDRAQCIYMAGEVVVGRMYIKIAERLKFNYVRMLTKGVGKVHWTETRSNGKSTYVVSFDAFEEYIHYNKIFIEKQRDGEDAYLEVGEWNWPFEVQLPKNLPTSFEHEFGRIRYTLEGHLDIPWALDKHVTLSISVVNPLDLNLSPALRLPLKESANKVICCCCCKSEPITTTLSIAKGGFVNGETIVFNATFGNKSGTDLGDISVKLIQKVLLHATSKSRECFRTIAEIKFNKKVKEQSYDEWNNGMLTIPAVCPSTNKSSRIIEISYYVNLHADPVGPPFSFDAYIPITIGTIPLNPAGNTANEINTLKFEPSKVEENSGLDEKKEGEVTNMDNNFAPHYPYYKDFSILPPKN